MLSNMNEYQHDRVSKIFKNLCILVLWKKVASALEGLMFALLNLKDILCFQTPVIQAIGIVMMDENIWPNPQKSVHFHFHITQV